MQLAGKKTAEIRETVKPDWDIWTDGCPEGESADQMRDRCDAMIRKIVDMAECVFPFLALKVDELTRMRLGWVCSAHHGKEETEGHHGDILIVSHGHFSRCFMFVPSLPSLLPLPN